MLEMMLTKARMRSGTSFATVPYGSSVILAGARVLRVVMESMMGWRALYGVPSTTVLILRLRV